MAAAKDIQVAQIIAMAEQVFASHDKALLWLVEPNSRLDDQTPLSMLYTEAGRRLVESILWQIDEGMFT